MDLISGALDGFTFMPAENQTMEQPSGYCVCKHCGTKVETGIMNLAEHWRNCWGKQEFEEMIADPVAYHQKNMLKLLGLL